MTKFVVKYNFADFKSFKKPLPIKKIGHKDLEHLAGDPENCSKKVKALQTRSHSDPVVFKAYKYRKI